jgi:hypothetical protein
LNEYNAPQLQADWERQMLEAAANPGKRTDWDLAWDCLLKLTETGDGEKIIRIQPDKRTERNAISSSTILRGIIISPSARRSTKT